jgi:CelD/BcsL family acetyltransferase involved in cellulose biosynthesis
MTQTAVLVEAWAADTRRGDDALDDLAVEWNDLYRRCAGASPFQAYAWVHSWWRSYGVPGRLRVFTVRHHGRLVAAAAFQLRWRAGCPVLTPLGGSITDFTDVLLDDELAAPAAQVLATAMVRDRVWQAIDLPESRPGSVTGLLTEAWPGARHETAGSLCLDLTASPMEDLVRELPSHSRKTVRRRLNQLKKASPEVREVPSELAANGIADLLALHERQWQGRGGNPEHLAPAFAAHLTRAVADMIGAGQAALFEYRFDGELLASSLVLIGRDVVGGYFFGVDPALRGRVDVTTMLLADALALAHRLGRPTMSMLRGAEGHKSTWRPAEAANRRLLLVRPGSLRGSGYARGVLAFRRAVEVAKDKTPWVKSLRDRLRWRR